MKGVKCECAKSLSDLENTTHENARGDVFIFPEGVLMAEIARKIHGNPESPTDS